jgi:hypothetical protein
VEKDTLVPSVLKGKEPAQDGYLNAVMLQHFSVIGKKAPYDGKLKNWIIIAIFAFMA